MLLQQNNLKMWKLFWLMASSWENSEALKKSNLDCLKVGRPEEALEGSNKHATGQQRKSDPCCTMAENFSELCLLGEKWNT